MTEDRSLLERFRAFEEARGVKLEELAQAVRAKRPDVQGLAYVLDAQGEVRILVFTDGSSPLDGLLPIHQLPLFDGAEPTEPLPFDEVLTGPVRACADRTKFYTRPFRGGVSGGGAPDGQTGPIGARVTRMEQGVEVEYALSCAHVLCEAANPPPGGDVVQPASSDDPSEKGNEIGTFAEAAPWQAATNDADAAIAKLYKSTMKKGIMGIGAVPNWRLRADVAPGLAVRKSGRTSPVVRSGTVVSVSGVVWWDMPGGDAAFRNVITTTRIADGGDSGSVVTATADKSAIGLACASSHVHTYVVSMEAIRDTLGVVISDRVWPN